jgi:hypothetical protein
MTFGSDETGDPAGYSYGSVQAHAVDSDGGREDGERLDREIAEHYLSNMKYGLEGTDGTMWSNYFAYMANNHSILSIFFTSPKNPYHKLNKALTFWNSTCLMFFYSCLFPGAMRSFRIALLVTLLMLPYSMLLHTLGTCKYARGRNCCVAWSHKIGSCVLFLLAFFGLIFIAAGLSVLEFKSKPVSKTIEIFIFSIFFSQLLPFVLGLANWYLLSWSGVLCCPQFSCNVDKYTISNEQFRCCPLLEVLPINFVLNMYCLGESTFAEDKKRFEELYPGRIAIDKFTKGDIRSFESGLLLQSSTSCPFNLDSTEVETIEHEATI